MVGLEPGEERLVAERAVFGDFGIAGAELARRQRVEHGGVGNHQAPAGERRRAGSCPAAKLMPVLPPTEESTCASSEVGTCTKSTAAAQDRRREAGEIADHAVRRAR